MSERWPAALRLDQAAEYCGLSVDTFKEVCTVAPIQFTESSHGRRWLRARLDSNSKSTPPKFQPAICFSISGGGLEFIRVVMRDHQSGKTR
jgi:hypothetical protein